MEILGRSEFVDLPRLGLSGLHAKIDTGAYNCSLHCSKAEVINGILEVILLDEAHPQFSGKKISFKKFDRRAIRNSFGEAEIRYVIRTSIRLSSRLIRAEFSLSNRGNLKFPVLLGRKILRKRFLIDVSEKDVSVTKAS
jgi:hypothetical protein